MPLEDPVLPAAVHLTSADVVELLRVPVAASGGHLLSARPVQVRYRPGSDLVVRYEASVRWPNTPGPVVETLLASTTRSGPLAGTVPLVADTEAGRLEVGVWRWPFDPLLPGLGAAVTPSHVADLLGLTDPPRVEVIAYRPTERAVVRIETSDHAVRYLKILPPGVAGTLAARHRALLDAGVPAPRVLLHDDDTGVLVMDELTGETLRNRLKAEARPWPPATAYLDLLTNLRSVTIPHARSVPGRVADAAGHAAMLTEVVPDERDRLERITARLQDGPLERSRARSGATVHGDLYESQLVVDGPRIIGVLDIDDVGPGDPLGDHATVLAHLRYRAAVTPRLRQGLLGYAGALRRDWAEAVEQWGGPAELDVVTAAALVGLATGPFRIQQRDWQPEVRRQIATIDSMLTEIDRAR